MCGKGISVSYPNELESIGELNDRTKHKGETQPEVNQETKGTNNSQNVLSPIEKEAESIGILDYPNMINARESNIKIPGQKTHIKGSGSLARRYNNFINRAKYLDVERLRQALDCDPH